MHAYNMSNTNKNNYYLHDVRTNSLLTSLSSFQIIIVAARIITRKVNKNDQCPSSYLGGGCPMSHPVYVTIHSARLSRLR